jgi:hypothetical protein
MVQLCLLCVKQMNLLIICVGSAISVYGTIGPGGNNSLTVSSYAINDSTSAVYAEPNVPDRMTKVLFYSSPALPPGEQTLKITNLGDQDFYWLDYFNITTRQATTTAAPIVQPSFTDASSVHSSIATISSSQPSTANATSVPPHPKEGITPGAAAGITLGATCLLALVILGYIWLRKDRHHVSNLPPLEGSHQDPTTHRTRPYL